MSDPKKLVPDDATEIDEATYMEGRVSDQLAYYSKAASNAKKAHIRVQSVIIVLGVLVPVVVNFPEKLGDADLSVGVRVAATVFSLAVAILSAIAGFRKWGDLWLSFRLTEELLKEERFLFLARAGRYEEEEGRFPSFVLNVESLISSEHQKFRSMIEEARRPQKEQTR